MSIRTIASSSPNRNSASVRASSVLPTPEGPRKMNEPVGRFGSLRPARERRIAFATTSTAGCWPMTRLCLLADRGALSGLAGLPLLFELALLLRQAPLLVTEVGGLLELLRLDRGFLVATGRLDLLLQLAVGGRRRHRLDPHPRRGLVDQVDRLVGQEAI
jgi:hypothetical protein